MGRIKKEIISYTFYFFQVFLSFYKLTPDHNTQLNL